MVQNVIQILDDKNYWLQVICSLDSGAGCTEEPIDGLRKYCGTIHKLQKLKRTSLRNDKFAYCENRGSIVFHFIAEDKGPIQSSELAIILLPKPRADCLVGREVLRNLDVYAGDSEVIPVEKMRTDVLFDNETFPGEKAESLEATNLKGEETNRDFPNLDFRREWTDV